MKTLAYIYILLQSCNRGSSFSTHTPSLSSQAGDQADPHSIPLLNPLHPPLEHLVGNEPISPNNGVGRGRRLRGGRFRIQIISNRPEHSAAREGAFRKHSWN